MKTNDEIVQALVTCKTLDLLFFNFTSEDIQYLQTNSEEFYYMVESNEYSIGKAKEFYNLFHNASLKTRQLILQRAHFRYWDEAYKSVTETIKFEAWAEEKLKDKPAGIYDVSEYFDEMNKEEIITKESTRRIRRKL